MFEQVKKRTINLQICECRKILLNKNDQLVERYTKFKKDLYYKCILKLQKTFDDSGTSYETKSCIICWKEFNNGIKVTKVRCGHIFCCECIEEWISQSTTCPYCRKDLDVDC